MHLTVHPLGKLTRQDLDGLGFNGYRTPTIRKVVQRTDDTGISWRIEKQHLDRVYEKEWETTEDTLAFFDGILREGHAYGAYLDDRLVGILLLSHLRWNNTLWIENLRVAKDCRGMGVGRLLIDRSRALARSLGVRSIGLETQSTNEPALCFYEACGFIISGIDLMRYPQRVGDRQQIGILMSLDPTDPSGDATDES